MANSVDATWDVDQINALHYALRQTLDAQPQISIDRLSTLSVDAEASVWAFLFGGPHPSNSPLSPTLKEQICSLSERSCDLAASAYKNGVSHEHTH